MDDILISILLEVCQGAAMSEPRYRLEGIVHTRNEGMEDFEGPLDIIFLLLSKNKIEIADVSITAILEQYLAYLEEMKRLDIRLEKQRLKKFLINLLLAIKSLKKKPFLFQAEKKANLVQCQSMK